MSGHLYVSSNNVMEFRSNLELKNATLSLFNNLI